MARLDFTKGQSSNMENWTETSIDTMQTDGVTDQKETEWINQNWSKYWGYFNAHPELKSAILMKAIWNVGKGFIAEDPTTAAILDHISGWGKDNFEDILFNLEVCRRVGGDAFAEIIRSEDGTLNNLKPLDPSSIKIVVNEKGIIKRYEQINKIGKTTKVLAKFKPEEILHLSNNRIADQIHGISDIESLDATILAELESFTDIRKVMHRQAKPFIIFKLKTDDQAKIDEFVSKVDALREKGEDLYIPDDENILSYEVVTVNVSSILLEWRNDIRNKFYRTIGLPQIVPGAGGQSTESESKVIYLAFEQIVERDQRFIEKQIWDQLGVKINLVPPTSIAGDMASDTAKDATQGLGFQPNETQAGVGR